MKITNFLTQPPRILTDRSLNDYDEHQFQGITPQQRKNMAIYINKRGEPQTHVVDEVVAPLSVSGKKQKIYPQDAFQLIIKYKAKDYCELLTTLMQQEPDLYWTYAAPHNIKHLEMTTNDMVKRYYRKWSWMKQTKDRQDYFTGEHGYLTVEDTRWWMNILAEVNGLTLLDLQRMVVPWLLQEHPKNNCLYIYGPSNTCKTKFARSLADGVYNLGMYLTSNKFYFQECKNTSMILWEGIKITDEKQLVSDCKKIFEGSSIKCNIKHRDRFWLRRTPVLCTSNYTPWHFVQDERVTFENRMYYLTFYEDSRLEPLVQHLNPMFWVEVLEQGRDFIPPSPQPNLLDQVMEEVGITDHED